MKQHKKVPKFAIRDANLKLNYYNGNEKLWNETESSKRDIQKCQSKEK